MYFLGGRSGRTQGPTYNLLSLGKSEGCGREGEGQELLSFAFL